MIKQPDSLRPWLLVNRLPGLTPRRLSDLINMFGSPDRFLNANTNILEKAGLSKGTLKLVSDYQSNRYSSELYLGTEQDLAWVSHQDYRRIISINCPEYPEQLKTIADPPAILFMEGRQLEILSTPQVAVVGSRSATHSGLMQAKKLSKELASAGCTVTSGLALGVDAAAHKGALETGLTIAVQGCGLNQTYPARHGDLAQKIRANGLIISEFPVGTSPRPHHFPRRNRIISGLSTGVLVVEAAEKSGSLITAEMALDQGREVFAVPGSISNPMASGCHRLIQQGAKLVSGVEDILSELPESTNRFEPEQNHLPICNAKNTLLLQAVDYDPTSLDLIANRLGQPSHELSEGLLELELDGHISRCPGGFVRI